MLSPIKKHLHLCDISHVCSSNHCEPGPPEPQSWKTWGCLVLPCDPRAGALTRLCCKELDVELGSGAFSRSTLPAVLLIRAALISFMLPDNKPLLIWLQPIFFKGLVRYSLTYSAASLILPPSQRVGFIS